MNMDEPVWVPTVFSKNRDRLMKGGIAEKFFALILDQAAAAGLLSDEHFSVDGTLIEAWASQKSVGFGDILPNSTKLVWSWLGTTFFQQAKHRCGSHHYEHDA